MTCAECEAAQADPDHCIYVRDCRGCVVRSLSQAPRFIREGYYRNMRDFAERDALIADVNAEYRRRQSLRVAA